MQFQRMSFSISPKDKILPLRNCFGMMHRSTAGGAFTRTRTTLFRFGTQKRDSTDIFWGDQNESGEGVAQTKKRKKPFDFAPHGVGRRSDAGVVLGQNYSD